MNERLVIAAVLLLTACATARQPAQPELAITIDDLPVHAPYPPGKDAVAVSREMIAALKAAHVPAYAVINGVNAGGPNAEVLKEWTDAGFQLGNHGWSHRHLSEMTAEEFEQELVRNEPLLRQAGGDSRWFRYPFLDEGDTAAKRIAGREVLARHGYRVAAVTMGFADWQWTAAYARCTTENNAAAVAELERIYLASAEENISVGRATSRKLYGRDIPYVLLMHVSAMSAHMMPRLLQLYRDAGFRFVSSADAERDEAYRAYTDLSLPPPPNESELAAGKGLTLPHATDYSTKLNAICPAGATASTR